MSFVLISGVWLSFLPAMCLYWGVFDFDTPCAGFINNKSSFFLSRKIK
jgi:hypothetical protein